MTDEMRLRLVAIQNETLERLESGELKKYAGREAMEAGYIQGIGLIAIAIEMDNMNTLRRQHDDWEDA